MLDLVIRVTQQNRLIRLFCLDRAPIIKCLLKSARDLITCRLQQQFISHALLAFQVLIIELCEGCRLVSLPSHRI